MKVSILIVSWNTCQLLLDCLQSIYTYPPQIDFEIRIVDNDSGDGSAQVVQERFPQVQVISSATNLGFASGNNLVAQHAQGQYLLLLNPDTVIHPQTIDQLVAFLDAMPNAGAVGPRMFNSDGSLQISTFRTPNLFLEAWQLLYFDRLFPLSHYGEDHKGPIVVDVLNGACILMRREIFQSLGGFDINFFMYSEEVDLCLRIRQAGWLLYYLPTAQIVHYGGQSTRQVRDLMFLELYRNKVRFFKKHYGSRQTVAYKILLWIVAVTRILPGMLASKLDSMSGQRLARIGHQYRLLMKHLAEF
jgi:GT2 family glycosyltransferase